MSEYNKMQTVKRRFFAMRNGVIADTLRKGGSTFRIIFGLNLPQIKEIADEIGHDSDLAMQLWENRSTRESRLLAPMLLDIDDITLENTFGMISSIDDVELADLFCHRFLRHHHDALAIADRLSSSEKPMDRYIALRLMFNVIRGNERKALEMAEAEIHRNDIFTKNIAALLREEASWRLS